MTQNNSRRPKKTKKSKVLPTDRPTDRPTHRPTDGAGCRVACMRLKKICEMILVAGRGHAWQRKWRMGYIFCGLFSFISAIADQPHVLIKTDKRQNGLFFCIRILQKLWPGGEAKGERRRKRRRRERERCPNPIKQKLGFCCHGQKKKKKNNFEESQDKGETRPETQDRKLMVVLVACGGAVMQTSPLKTEF